MKKQIITITFIGLLLANNPATCTQTLTKKESDNTQLTTQKTSPQQSPKSNEDNNKQEDDFELFDELWDIDETEEKSQQTSRWQKFVTWIKNHPVIASLIVITTGAAATLACYALYKKLRNKKKTNSSPDTDTDPQPQTPVHTSWQVYDLNTKTASKQDQVFAWDDSLKENYKLTDEKKMSVSIVVDKGKPYLIKYQKAQNKKDSNDTIKDSNDTIKVTTKGTLIPVNTWEDDNAFTKGAYNTLYYCCDNDKKIFVGSSKIKAGTIHWFIKHDKDNQNQTNDPRYYLINPGEDFSLDLKTIKKGFTTDTKGNVYSFYVAEAQDPKQKIEVVLTSPVLKFKAKNEQEAELKKQKEAEPVFAKASPGKEEKLEEKISEDEYEWLPDELPLTLDIFKDNIRPLPTDPDNKDKKVLRIDNSHCILLKITNDNEIYFDLLEGGTNTDSKDKTNADNKEGRCFLKFYKYRPPKHNKEYKKSTMFVYNRTVNCDGQTILKKPKRPVTAVKAYNEDKSDWVWMAKSFVPPLQLLE
jgi:hypothetical protein